MIAGMLIGACALGIIACWLRVRGYRGRFPLAARRNDQLVCRADPQRIAVTLGPQGFEWPPHLDVRGRTALLQLVVRARPGGRLFDPYIEIGTGPSAFRQYFERGAVGQRYLNLSPRSCADNVDLSQPHVAMRGHWMHWDAEAYLLLYNAPMTANAGVLVLAPHPDDAEIAAFGLYAGHRSWIVTLTAGERSTAQLPSAVPAGERTGSVAALRVADSLAVPGLGKVPPERRVNLVCPDGALEAMHREPAREFYLACEETLGRRELRASNPRAEFQAGGAGCTWNELVGEMRGLLAATRADIIVCPHPELDTHPDHLFTAVALEQALRGLDPAPLLFLYVVHNRDAPCFPLGPASSVVGLLPGNAREWVAESVYSHALEPLLQRAKHVALESMYATAGSSTGLRSALGDRLSGIDGGPLSFLRRAPRPNEMYYVLRSADLPELVGRALRRRAAR